MLVNIKLRGDTLDVDVGGFIIEDDVNYHEIDWDFYPKGSGPTPELTQAELDSVETQLWEWKQDDERRGE